MTTKALQVTACCLWNDEWRENKRFPEKLRFSNVELKLIVTKSLLSWRKFHKRFFSIDKTTPQTPPSNPVIHPTTILLMSIALNSFIPPSVWVMQSKVFIQSPGMSFTKRPQSIFRTRANKVFFPETPVDAEANKFRREGKAYARWGLTPPMSTHLLQRTSNIQRSLAWPAKFVL